MNVWRKQTTRTRNGKAEKVYSKRFYGTLRTANGKRKQVPLTLEQTSSLTLLRRLQVNEDDKRAAGVTDRVANRLRPVSELLDDYETYLKAKRNTSSHVTKTLARIRCVFAATHTSALADVDANRILATLDAWRKRGVPSSLRDANDKRKPKPLSVSSTNHYLIACKAFTRWAWRERLTSDDPLAGLRRLNAGGDRRRKRRALTPTELDTLTSVTQTSGKTYRGNDWRFTPTDRAMLYRIAASTGLRASELASLTMDAFDFDALTFTMDAAYTKNRKTTTLPLSPTLASALRSWFATLKRNALFPGSWAKGGFGGRLLKRDLRRCGIEYRDAAGRYVDFHALRYTFITRLANAGVHPSKAQRLARHSTITLTMDVYTSLDVDDLRDAIAAI